MEETKTETFIKERTPLKQYSLAFKLKVIEEVELGQIGIEAARRKYDILGHSTILKWLRKHGRLGWYKGVNMKELTPQKRIKQLEKELQRLRSDKEILEIALDVAKEDLGIDIRKKYLTKLSEEQSKQERIARSAR
jgi:transposase-like protein